MNPAPPAALPVIDMQNVSVHMARDPDVTVVEAARWLVNPGDYWAIGGLQGAGKTDFLLLTAGLMSPSMGEYRFFGDLMPIFEEHRLAQRLRLGLVFDGGQLFNHLTVAENIALPLRYHRNLDKREVEPEVERMLAWMGLESWADSTPGTLGRNWQKRVGLARALMLKPELLLLDNPLAGLDLRHRGWWLSFLDRLSRGHEWLHGKPATLVVAAADLQPWVNRARQFALLKDRQFVPVGSRDDLQKSSDELIHELLTVAQSV